MARFLNMDPIASSPFPPFEIGSSLGSKGFRFEGPIMDPQVLGLGPKSGRAAGPSLKGQGPTKTRLQSCSPLRQRGYEPPTVHIQKRIPVDAHGSTARIPKRSPGLQERSAALEAPQTSLAILHLQRPRTSTAPIAHLTRGVRCVLSI